MPWQEKESKRTDEQREEECIREWVKTNTWKVKLCFFVIFVASIVSVGSEGGGGGSSAAHGADESVPDDSMAFEVAATLLTVALFLTLVKDIMMVCMLKAAHDKQSDRHCKICLWFIYIPPTWYLMWIFCSRQVNADMVIQFRRARRRQRIVGRCATIATAVATVAAAFASRGMFLSLLTATAADIVDVGFEEVMHWSVSKALETAIGAAAWDGTRSMCCGADQSSPAGSKGADGSGAFEMISPIAHHARANQEDIENKMVDKASEKGEERLDRSAQKDEEEDKQST